MIAAKISRKKIVCTATCDLVSQVLNCLIWCGTQNQVFEPHMRHKFSTPSFGVEFKTKCLNLTLVCGGRVEKGLRPKSLSIDRIKSKLNKILLFPHRNSTRSPSTPIFLSLPPNSNTQIFENPVTNPPRHTPIRLELQNMCTSLGKMSF